MTKYVKFLIDSFERDKELKRALRKAKIPFKQETRVSNVILIREDDKDLVVAIAQSLEIEWQWAE